MGKTNARRFMAQGFNQEARRFAEANQSTGVAAIMNQDSKHYYCDEGTDEDPTPVHRCNQNEPTDIVTEARELVGRAFLCSDGLIRWVTHLSKRNYYSLLWLSVPENVWHSGGIVKAEKWEGGKEVQAPQPGERYRQAGATGIISEHVA